MVPDVLTVMLTVLMAPDDEIVSALAVFRSDCRFSSQPYTKAGEADVAFFLEKDRVTEL